MSTNKNKKKKKKSKLNPKIILLSALGLVFLISAILIIINTINKGKYYELTSYTLTYVTNEEEPTVLNYFDDFQYYRLYLHDDNTFTLKLKRKKATVGSIPVEETYNGTYEMTDTRLSLKYTNFREEDLTDDEDIAKYTIEGNKLIREQYINASDGLRHTVKQVFEK